MEDTKQSFSTKKFMSILFMVLALVTLNLNWFQFTDNNMEFADELKEDFEDDMRFLEDSLGGDIESALEQEGYSQKEIKSMMRVVDGTEKMVDTIGKGKYSVWSAVNILLALADMKPGLTDESFSDDLYARDMEETIMALQVLFGIVVGIFAIVALFMILAVWAHVRNKNALGIGAMVITLIFVGIVGFLGMVIRAGIGEPGNGITLAPILTVVFTIISCIIWGSARKQIPQKTTDELY